LEAGNGGKKQRKYSVTLEYSYTTRELVVSHEP
jgi:hypothetical protein